MSNQRFLMENIIIEKFRGYNERKEFKLFPNNMDKRGIILLSGPNGFGKSSFIDAVEWCLTGKIKRLEEQFDKRKEKTIEKQKGLLRNTTAQGIVSVEIQGVFGDQKIRICREYTGNKDYDDGFFNKKTKLVVYCNDNIIIDSSRNADVIIDNLPFINYNLSKNFYDRFVCSHEKTIHIYEKGRGEFYEMFSLFLGGTEEIEVIENNLEGYSKEVGKKQEKVAGLLEQIKSEKELLSTEITQKKSEMEGYKNQLNKFNDNLKSSLHLDDIINSYPKLLVYKDEKLIAQLYEEIQENKIDIQWLAIQKNALTSINNIKQEQALYLKSAKVIEYLENRNKYEDFYNNLYVTYKAKSDSIELCKNVNYDLICKQKEELQNQKINIDQNITNFEESYKLVQEKYDKLYKVNSKEYIDNKLKCEQLKVNIKEYIDLQTLFSSYDKADPVINALEALIDHLDGFKKYRQQSKECPLCHSSENFNSEGIELGENARQALLKYDQERTVLKDKLRKQQEIITEEILRMYQSINSYLENNIEIIEPQIKAFADTSEIRYETTKYELDFKELNENLIENKLKELKSKIDNELEVFLQEDMLQSLSDSDGILRDIPSRLSINNNATIDEFNSWSNNEKLDTLKNYVSVGRSKKTEYELLTDINDISDELLKVKIDTLTKIKDILEGQAEIKNISKLIENCKNEIKQKTDVLLNKDRIEDKLEEIRTSVKAVRSSVDDEIMKNLNDPLNYIFKRINRHNIYDNIELRKPTRGVAKNAEFNINNIFGQSTFIPNIVSTGQLSAITLSVFLTVAMGQRHLPFRCYFMDDPIQSMDDINILSFIDLLRTELGANVDEENRFADQLFIATCNEDLEALIKHKAKHFQIGISNFKFDGYGSFIEY